MLDRTSREELQRLRAEIKTLKDGPVRGRAWEAWYRQTNVLLGRVYGLGSVKYFV
jgi:hypothetical protein